MKKDVRKIKVYEQSGHNYKPTPTIMLKGLWLEELGFGVGRVPGGPADSGVSASGGV